MAKTSMTHDAEGRSVYRLSIVEWQCFGTSLPSRFYVTTDIPQFGNPHDLGVSYIYSSADRAAAEDYVRAVVSTYRDHPRLRYLEAGYFDARPRAKHASDYHAERFLQAEHLIG